MVADYQKLKFCLRALNQVNHNAEIAKDRTLTWRLGYAINWVTEALAACKEEEVVKTPEKDWRSSIKVPMLTLPELHNAVTIVDTVKPVIIITDTAKERVKKYLNK